MSMKMTAFALILYSMAYTLLFGTWVGIVFNSNRVVNADQLISYIQLTLASLTGHVLTMINSTTTTITPTPEAPSQGGFANPLLLLILCIVGLCGCAGFQQAVSGYESAAIKGIQAAEDNNIHAWTANACGTPISAMIRNPGISPALLALCLPGGKSSDPAAFFNALTPQVTK